jgi:hypothetical protein
MTSVRLLGWSPGLNKVRLTKLIHSSAGLPLDEAHAAVSRLLAGEVVELRIDSLQTAQQLAASAHALGVQAECVSTPESSSLAG